MSEIAAGIVNDRIRVTVNGALTIDQTYMLADTLIMLARQLESEEK